MNLKRLDIFCEIIDNYGDIGVVYRLAKELKFIYKDKVEIRVILNKLEEFMELNKKAKNIGCQEIDGIIYLTNEYLAKNICTFSPANVIIEAFGCSILEEYLEKAKDESELLINLEYLSGEDWVEGIHLMESPLGAKKLKKYFFMPGFTEKTGGVIVDSLFIDRKKIVLKNKEVYMKKYLPELCGKNYFLGTIFSYEKNFLPLLDVLLNNKKENCLLVLGEKSQESIKEILENKNIEKIDETCYKYENILLKFMPFLKQEEYEELINLVDYNFVRGEDSFVRALLTGKPFIWHIYLQDEMAHMDKIDGFINQYRKTLNNSGLSKALDIHTELLRDYNLRNSNSLELGKERFENFFNEFDNISKLSQNYSEYIELKCNLIDKLNKFILKY
ncbi:elongation factor P maturation arginine rhamnosyltransferase EarP [Candidatus Cetobacterium colombiensis]|uniref:Protein-arginine rhamnosyltransferase n=1 Tax=Candidatus Cetobacterium colombiensis TaxID=3073100 RepID=A0ABU4WC68_9FUSO|nr:elongation factor P maturation arginine rhamnosyltransferase EarP [Candidatus Cetobacterium colombiensis]MDX8336294.1 elongation factor P maturation arginine rhamnosyltransferase EarP [Candidatus Cetobacterium colombiensis]